MIGALNLNPKTLRTYFQHRPELMMRTRWIQSLCLKARLLAQIGLFFSLLVVATMLCPTCAISGGLRLLRTRLPRHASLASARQQPPGSAKSLDSSHMQLLLIQRLGLCAKPFLRLIHLHNNYNTIVKIIFTTLVRSTACAT